MPILTLATRKFRIYYKALFSKLIRESVMSGQKNLVYWQNKLFTSAIVFALSISLFALVPSTILELQEGRIYIVIVNIICLGSVAVIALNKNIDITLRKMFVCVLVVVFAIVMIAFMGSFTLACVYLFPLSVFVALQFSNRVAYSFVGLNLLICTFFAFVLWMKPFNLPFLFKNISLNHWLIYSVNFLFMDVVVVMLIRMLLTGLDRTMNKEAFLHKELQKELQEKTIRNAQLKESVEHYRTLFFQSPLPKWILDSESLQFLQVNDAAIRNYGYSEQEFLTMKLPDLYDDKQSAELAGFMQTPAEQSSIYISKHIKKDGKEMHVELRRSDIFFNGKNASMLIATDISDRTSYVRAIEQKNAILQDIAYVQSHVVRVPVANIIGITDLLMQQPKTEAEHELLTHLVQSVKQLDEVVSQIVRHAEEVLPQHSLSVTPGA